MSRASRSRSRAKKMEVVRSSLFEIQKSGALKSLGGLIALFHVALFYFWHSEGHLPLKLVAQGQAMCWSFMDSCGWLHIFPVGFLSLFYYAYPVFAILAAAFLLLTDWASGGFYLLMIASYVGFFLFAQDLRLSSNETYFIFLFSFAYLYVPSKHRLMRLLVVSMFAAHGISELAPDWLMGTWYTEHIHVPGKLAEWLAALSVLVQTIGAGAMLFRDARYFWSGWLSVFVYTCAHLYMGEWLASCIALGCLAYVALDELELRKAERQYIYQSFIRPEPSLVWGAILLAIFWAAQTAPFFQLPRDSKVRRALNVWALHPEAAHEECDQETFAVYKNRIEETTVEPQALHQPAMFCNPYLRFLDLKGACKVMKEKDPDFVTFSSVFQVRNFRDKTSYRAFEVKDFCNDDLTYKQISEARWTTNPAK